MATVPESIGRPASAALVTGRVSMLEATTRLARGI